MGDPLLAKKPMDWLLNEAQDSGEHTLKRTLGAVSLTALGVGAIIGAGIFVLSGLGAHYAGPGLMLSFIISGLGCAFAGLCYAEFAALIPLAGSAYTYAYAALGELFAWIIGWDLTLEYRGREHGFFRLVEPLHRVSEYFSSEDAAVACLRPLDGAGDGGKRDGAADGARFRSFVAVGRQAFLLRVGDIIRAQPPELVQRAHDMVAAPTFLATKSGSIFRHF